MKNLEKMKYSVTAINKEGYEEGEIHSFNNLKRAKDELRNLKLFLNSKDEFKGYTAKIIYN